MANRVVVLFVPRKNSLGAQKTGRIKSEDLRRLLNERTPGLDITAEELDYVLENSKVHRFFSSGDITVSISIRLWTARSRNREAYTVRASSQYVQSGSDMNPLATCRMFFQPCRSFFANACYEALS
jgi:hypothetical protein